MGRRSAVLLALVALISACGGGEEKIPDQVTGVVLEVESSGLNEVDSFVLKSGDETYEIFIADDVEYGFPLGHLSEHLASAEPVRVQLEERDGKPVALSIEDI